MFQIEHANTRAVCTASKTADWTFLKRANNVDTTDRKRKNKHVYKHVFFPDVLHVKSGRVNLMLTFE